MKDQEERLLKRIRDYYTTSSKLRDLIDECEDYLKELEVAELKKAMRKITALNASRELTEEEKEERELQDHYAYLNDKYDFYNSRQ